MASNNNRFSSEQLLYALLFISVFGLGYWFYTSLEYKKVEKDQGYQGEAISNDYLAAEFYLLRMGQKVQKIKLFGDHQTEFKKHDTLLVPSVRLAFDSRRSEKMLEWVKNGGHLIITGRVEKENDSNQRDHILESLGLQVRRKVLKKDSTQYENPVDVSISDDAFLQVDFDDYLTVEKTQKFNAEIIWSIEDEDRTHGLQIKLGNGYLTLLSDMRLFKNDYIDAYDHATFLYLLTTTQLSEDESSTFYYSLYEDHLSLLQWLWDNAQLLVISFMVLIMMSLWMIVPRFGPLINVAQPVHRHFLDHLSAAGNYHWRQGNYAYLINVVRKQLSQQVKRKFPEWSNLSKQDQILHFADISQLNSVAIEKALFETDIQQANDYINKIKILEKLRKSL